MHSTTISYRDAHPHDIPTIVKLIKGVHGDDRFIRYQQFVVACCNAKIVGCIRTVQAEIDCKEVASLVVLPQFRNKRIGSMLISKVLAKDTSRPLYVICLKNKVGFYQRHNFHEANIDSLPSSLKRDFIRMTKNKKSDLSVMELGYQ